MPTLGSGRSIDPSAYERKLTGFEVSPETGDMVEVIRCVRCELAPTFAAKYRGRIICHTVLVPPSGQQYPVGYGQCLEATRASPLRGTAKFDNWIISVHKHKNESGTDASHIHAVHACQTRDADHRTCRCTKLIQWRPVGWTLKRTYHDWSDERITNLFVYLQKEGRSIHEVGIARASYGRSGMLAVEAHEMDEQSSKCGPGCSAPNYGGEQRDEICEDICLGERAAQTSQPQPSPVPRGGSKSQRNVQVGKALAKRIMEWCPESVNNLLVMSEFEKEFEELQWDKTLFDQLAPRAWTYAVRNFNRLSFRDIAEQRWRHPVPFMRHSTRYYTPEWSAQLLGRLLLAQYTQVGTCQEFVQTVVNIIDKKVSKVNTLLIVGEPSSGKTFFTNSLLWLLWNFGKIRNGSGKGGDTFPFGDALDKRVNDWSECKLGSDSFVDTAKLAWEGQPCSVNAKYKSDCTLNRTPILITCNAEPWLMCPKEKRAFKDRCSYNVWTRQPWLKDVSDYPCPLGWKIILDNYEDAAWWEHLPAEEQFADIYEDPDGEFATNEHNFEDWLVANHRADIPPEFV